MSTIQLDISDIYSLKSRLANIKYELENCYNSVTTISNSLDMKVRKRKDIDSDLNKIKSDLVKYCNYLNQCETLIVESLNNFAEAEKIGTLPDIGARISGGSGVSFGSGGGSGASFGSGGGAGRGFGTGLSFVDFVINTGIISTLNIIDLFSKNKFINTITNGFDVSVINEYASSKWSDLKNLKKGFSFSKEIAKISEAYGGKVPEWMNDVSDSKIFDIVGYISDGQKLISGIIDKDNEEVLDVLGKYGVSKQVAHLVKLGGESSAGASLVGDFAFQRLKSTAEVYLDTGKEIYDVLANPDSDWKDYAKCIKSLCQMDNKIDSDTWFNVVGNKAQTMADILDFTGLGNFSETFENVTGKEDANIIDFYETAGSEISKMQERVGVGGVIKYFAEGTREVISEYCADLSETSAQWAQSFKGAVDQLKSDF